MRPTLHIHLLGDFLLTSNDTPITTVSISRLQSLLAYLLLHRDAPQNRSHLAFLLWPDSTEAQAHTNLRKLLYQLRQALPNIDQFLYTDKQTLQWRPAGDDAPWTLDIQELEQALSQAKQAEQAQDMATLQQALEQVLHLYRGDLLPGCYEEWILPERDRWHQQFLLAAERLIALLEQKRDYDAAIMAGQQLLRQDPLHEATYRQLMRLYALRGDRAAALRTYHACVTVLERELGTEPGAITQGVYEALMQSDLPARTLTGSLSLRGAAPPLLGRKAEWRLLLEAWRKMAKGQQRIVILSGEAGIGKTRLAEEMEAWVSRQGMATASAHCYAALGPLAYAPVTGWLRSDALQAGLSALDPPLLTEIARLVPEVLTTRPHLSHPAAMTEGWQRQIFFEALARAVLSAHQPLLLFLDDMQWCDHETLEWLHYLLRFDPQARVLLLGTVRAEEILPGHPLQEFLSAVQRDDLVTEIAPGPLTLEETTSLAEHILGQPLAPAMSMALHSETEGNPLFVVEMARAGTLEQQGDPHSSAGNTPPLLTQNASTLPPSVQTVLATRLAQLSPLAHEVANVAAVIGRAFPFSILARASGRSEDDVVQGLDELWQRRLVREQGAGTAEMYDFSHDKLREIAYASLSPVRQRLLHRRVAEAFEVVYMDNLDAVSGQIAAHYERARLPEQAIPYYRRAGELALQVYASTDAMTAFQRAANLLEAGAPSSARLWEDAAGIYAGLGDIFLQKGQLQEAREAYQQGAALVPSEEYIWRARLLRKIATAWNYASNNPHDTLQINARQAFQEAESILMDVSDPSNQMWRDEWINLQAAHIWPLRGSVDDMTAAIEKARPVIEQYGTQEQRKLLTEAIGIRNMFRSRFASTEQAVASRRDALAMAEQARDKSKIATGHLALGITLLWADHLDEAEEHLWAALSMAEQADVAWLKFRCLTFLPFIFRCRGQVEAVRNLLIRAQDAGATQNNSILTGHRAWIAWREGNLAEVEIFGRQSVGEGQQQQAEVNPFQWVGFWPLMGAAIVQDKIAVAIDNVRMLLDPTQQPPPEQLKGLLEGAVQAWDTGKQDEASALLLQAVPVAETMGYL